MFFIPNQKFFKKIEFIEAIPCFITVEAGMFFMNTFWTTEDEKNVGLKTDRELFFDSKQ